MDDLKRKKVYIAGAITSDPEFETKFAIAERKIDSMCIDVINPAKLASIYPTLSYGQYMTIDFKLIGFCDAVYFLDDWKEGEGAKKEFRHCFDINRKVFFENQLSEMVDYLK